MSELRPAAWTKRSTTTRAEGILERLKEWLVRQNARSIEPAAYDPSHLGDAIAMRTEWGPAAQGGTSLRTHRLLHVGPRRRAEFHPTVGARAFFAVFTMIGLGVFAGFATAATQSIRTGSWLVAIFMLVPILIGGVFAALGAWLWWFYGAPVVFDRQRGEYWKGRTSPAEAGNRHTFKERMNVVDHGNRESLRKDAAELARFLGNPLWDATDPPG